MRATGERKFAGLPEFAVGIESREVIGAVDGLDAESGSPLAGFRGVAAIRRASGELGSGCIPNSLAEPSIPA